ncbi:helix-turn-helix domain-containing protein [Streptomyces sp. YIM 98790]|uniref:helix-turn-helix domain-containing protein n=1 Tax=Streptomyces sp. YIM 98790 TaxID=2689077 RepID=UPI001409202B|nr:helix-turn-helix domain-containing protein [Streptomyces sp. YIM 98790]
MTGRPGGTAAFLPGGAYIPGPACFPLWQILRRELGRHRADGGQLRPDIAAALDALRAAAHAHMSAAGPDSRTPAADQAACEQPLVTTAELAARLGVSDRHARRLAAASGIRPAARGAWHTTDADHLQATRKDAA